MPFNRTQTVFSTGELDPRLHARIDIDRYRTALAEARDVTLTPQGPVRRRPGTVLDYDSDGIPTWILPFQMEQSPAVNVSDTFDFGNKTPGDEVVSDNEINVTDDKYVHIFARFEVSQGTGSTSSPFRARIELYDGAEWVATPYSFVPADSGNAQDLAGGVLVQLSEDKSDGLERRSYSKLRLRVDEAPDADFVVDFNAQLHKSPSNGIKTSNVKLEPFNLSETEQFIVAFTDNCATVFERTEEGDGTRRLEQRASIKTFYDNSEVLSIDTAQAFNTMIVVQGNTEPERIIRDGDSRLWRFKSVAFGSDFVVEPEAIHVPTEPVNDANADNVGQPAIWTIDFQNMSNDERYQVAVDGEFTRELEFDADTPSNNTSRLEPALNSLPGFSGSFTVSDQGGNEYNIEYDFSDLSLKPVISDVEGLVLEGTGIISVWRTQKGIAHTNDKWSNSLGWPRSVALYQGRLWFGGSASYPDEIWGSRADDIYSFWNAENLDNEAILAQIRSRQLLNIRAIYPGRNLQFFTDSAEFFAPQSLNDPLTPNNFIISRATNRGILKNIPPVEITGATMFIEQTGDALREFLFIDTEQSYNAQDVSLLSSHLLVDPKALKRWPAKGGQEFDIILVPNGAAGDMALFGSLRDQDVAGWWRWSGRWLDVEVMLDDLHGVLDTFVNGDPCNILCRFDEDAFMDLLTKDTAGKQVATNGIIPDLWVHKGRDVQIRTDGSFSGEATLIESEEDRYTGDGNPQIDIGEANEFTYQLGLPFTPKVKQLPTVIETQGDVIWMDRKKRVMGGIIDVIDTAAIEVATLDDESNAERYAAPVTISQNQPDLTTGRVVFKGRLGWDDKAAVTITQPLPYPMQILAIQTRIDL